MALKPSQSALLRATITTEQELMLVAITEWKLIPCERRKSTRLHLIMLEICSLKDLVAISSLSMGSCGTTNFTRLPIPHKSLQSTAKLSLLMRRQAHALAFKIQLVGGGMSQTLHATLGATSSASGINVELNVNFCN